MTLRLTLILMVALTVGCIRVGSMPSPSPSSFPTATAPTGPLPTPSPSPVRPPVLEITASAFVEDLAWIVTRSDGSAELLRHSDDRGATWSERSIPSIVNYVNELQFVDPKSGWMIGFAHRGLNSVGCAAAAPPGTPPCRQILFRTQDGGRLWSALRTVPTWPAGGASLAGVQFVDEGYGWILERRPCPTDALRPCFDVLATSNGGDTWTPILVGQHVGQVRFVDRRHGWALTRDTEDADAKVIATADGGRTWHTQIAGEPLVSLAVPDVATAIALSVDGAYCTASLCQRYGLFRVVGGALETLHETSSAGWHSPGGCRGSVRHMVFSDALRGWLVLGRGAGGVNVPAAALLMTTDGGRAWRCVDGFPVESVLSLRFVDASRGWMTTRGPDVGAALGTTRLWRTSDGGLTWERVLE